MKTANIKLSYDGRQFIAVCDFDSRNIVRESGFRFDEPKKLWYTDLLKIAARLREYSDASAEKIFARYMLKESPWSGPLIYPKEFKLQYYQPLAAQFALARNRSYLGVAPGLGKTIMAAVTMSTINKSREAQFVYVCPSFLIKNVMNELAIWSPELDTEHFDEPKLFGNVMLVPDSLFAHRDIYAEICNWYKPGRSEKVLFVDEAHRFKNPDSERSRVMYGHKTRKGAVAHRGVVNLFDRRIHMSGSPMPNRPLELYSALHSEAPETIDFMDRDSYGLKYCAGRLVQTYGANKAYDFSGASNLTELARRVHGTYMYRLRKEALKLPPLMEEVFVIGDDLPGELQDFDLAFQKQFKIEDIVKRKIEIEYQWNDMHLMTYQRLLGIKKIPYAVELIEHMLEETDENILVFARHTEVIKGISDLLKKKKIIHTSLTSDVALDRRLDVVNEYQKNEECRVLLGSLRVMGLGFNITKATRGLNVEPSWATDENDQGRDRMHRYGQTKTVVMQHMVYRNSIDHKVIGTNLRKLRYQSYV